MQEPDRPFGSRDDPFATDHLERDLRATTIRGGGVTVVAQGLRFVLQITSTMLLARLLTPSDFGMIAMVTAVTGFVELFMDLGLAMATVQRLKITHAQVTTLFWINLAVAAALMIATITLAPAISWFYDEPRLEPLTVVLASAFVLGGVGAQHQALLRRKMRFTALASIDVGSNLTGAIAAVAAAFMGLGVWSLVVQRLAASVWTSCALWMASGWRPTLTFDWAAVRPMLALGGHLTGFNTINYFARNADNLLIGRWWGPQALGLYSRAYQLLLLPLQQVNNPISSVAIPGLSRLQADPERFRSFYLQALALAVAATMPLAVSMTVLSDEIVAIVLGPQWGDASILFRLLAGAVLVRPACNTAGWLHVATGRTHRMLRWGIFYSALVVASFVVGLPYGPRGVAACYSGAMLLQAVPCLWFATRGTRITLPDIGGALSAPVVSSLVAGAVAAAVSRGPAVDCSPWLRVVLAGAVFAAVYSGCLLGVFRKWSHYRRIFRELQGRKS